VEGIVSSTKEFRAEAPFGMGFSTTGRRKRRLPRGDKEYNYLEELLSGEVEDGRRMRGYQVDDKLYGDLLPK
jgi:hypothetical protein